MDDELKQRIRELRGIGVSINDIRRQTGATEFDIYEVLEGYDAAIKRKARKHLMRGTGWPWERSDNNPERPRKPTGDPAEDAAQGIVSYMRELDTDLDGLLNDKRRRVLDVVAEIARRSGIEANGDRR